MNKWKFLLVDDSKMSNKILSDILINAGHSNIVTFRSAIDALAYLKEDNDIASNIVMTDLIMPVMDGIELSRIIKSDARFSDIPIVMITSSNNIENLQEAFSIGVLDYIIKPFNSVEIITRINSVLRLKDEMEKRLAHEKSIELLNKMLVEDLNIARHLQFQMLPPSINLNEISIKGFYLPIMTLGGDLYYFEKISENKYGVILLDIMGHGTVTSMITMYIRSNLPPLFKIYENPVDLIKSLNDFIIEFNANLGDIEYHCSAFYIVFNTKNRTVNYVNAGHPPLAFIQSNKKVTWMDKGCPPIGIFKNINIMHEVIPYGCDSYAVTYSDGLYELLREKSVDISLFNEELILAYDEFLNGNISPIEKIFKAIGNMDRFDDVSLVLIKLSVLERELE